MLISQNNNGSEPAQIGEKEALPFKAKMQESSIKCPIREKFRNGKRERGLRER